MTQRALHEFRIYTADDGDVPAGVVGLTNVDRNFKTASLWAVLGNKRYGGPTTRAGDHKLTPAVFPHSVPAPKAGAGRAKHPAPPLLPPTPLPTIRPATQRCAYR